MNIEAFFSISYGLYAVCTKSGTKLNGYISNTVFQVTSDPPQIAVSCSKNNLTTGMIEESRAFSISVLEKNTGPDIIGSFGYRSGKDINKFEKVNYRTGVTGVPILMNNTLVWFECRVKNSFDLGTHILFIAEVVESEVNDTAGEPLTYDYYRVYKKGKSPRNAPTYVDDARLKAIKEKPKADKYYCPACGYIYDPETGDTDGGIAPGTRFEDIPGNWVCPNCGIGKADFIKVI
jgi:flavin reductase (DIM6/NTAB) family NADH-FMN oxidoreductase RutF/rubredoxin